MRGGRPPRCRRHHRDGAPHGRTGCDRPAQLRPVLVGPAYGRAPSQPAADPPTETQRRQARAGRHRGDDGPGAPGERGGPRRTDPCRGWRHPSGRGVRASARWWRRPACRSRRDTASDYREREGRRRSGMTTRRTMTMTRRRILDGRSRPRTFATMLLTAAVWLTAAAAADAQAVATVTPDQAAKASRLHWAVDGTLPPINGQIPISLTMSAPPGFTLNTAAAAKRCKPLQAKLDECPSKSHIGSAVLTIHVEKPGGPRDLPIPVKLYLGPKNSLLAVAFLAGVRVVPGSISGSNGISVTLIRCLPRRRSRRSATRSSASPSTSGR